MSSEAPGSQRTHALGLKWEKDKPSDLCVGSSSLRPRSSSILWRLHAQKPGSLFFSVAQKLSSVSPRAITTSSLQTGGSCLPRTEAWDHMAPSAGLGTDLRHAPHNFSSWAPWAPSSPLLGVPNLEPQENGASFTDTGEAGAGLSDV